jgi:GxxExxY protein
MTRTVQRLSEEEVFKIVLDACYSVHSALGPGLLESAYEECLYFELLEAGLTAVKQKPMPLIYKEIRLDIGYRVDLYVENKVIVEIKSVDALNDIHLSQILTYLKLSGCKLGLLINFNPPSRKASADAKVRFNSSVLAPFFESRACSGVHTN